ncbi:MAG: hypothetical protein LC745_07935 [Planctomycetia bacterium]|nr:hypothetical protein [Planctomycetia bacterium]
MTEILSLPGWKIEETPLSAWVDQFAKQGLVATVTRESTGVSWIEVHALGLRGYAVIEDGRYVEAINFELAAPDPVPARDALFQAAAALSWDLDEDDDGSDDD